MTTPPGRRRTLLPEALAGCKTCWTASARPRPGRRLLHRGHRPDGLVHLFGCGHSRMICEEMTPRQGCFVGWHTIVELGLTFHNLIVGPNGLRQSLHLEKTPGYAEQILRNFAFGPKDVMIVISTSGIREVIIEMAEGAKRRGLAVIGVVSRAHCEQAKPAHRFGQEADRRGRRHARTTAPRWAIRCWPGRFGRARRGRSARSAAPW